MKKIQISCTCILQNLGKAIKSTSEAKYNSYVKRRENGIIQNAQLKSEEVENRRGSAMLTLNKKKAGQVLVAHVCNPSCLGGYNQEDHGLRRVLTSSSQDPTSKVT
jgi:hypothetical protein